MKKGKCNFLRAWLCQSKIQTSVILLILFCISPLLAGPCGDVNSNGSIDILDALLIAQYYVGLNPANFDTSAADVNGDGVIDIVDSLVIAQYYVNLIDELPGCVIYEIQAEDGTWDNASVDNNFDGYTGTGFVNTENSTGTWIEWSVKSGDTCTVACEFRYACGGNSRPMDLSINGNVIETLGFPATGAWNTWETEEADVILDAGINVIRLTAAGDSGGPNIDKLSLTGCGAMTTPVQFKWTADNVNNNSWTLDGWTSDGGVIQLNFDETTFGEIISPGMYLKVGVYDTIYVRMRNTSPVTRLLLEYKTQEIQSWDQDRLIEIVFRNNNVDNFTDYKIDLNNVSKWSGIVTQFKLYPSESSFTGSIEIESLRIAYNTYPDDIIIYWESTLNKNDSMDELRAIEIFNYTLDDIKDVINQDPLTNQDAGYVNSAITDLANLYDNIDFQGLFNNIDNYPDIEMEMKPEPDAEYISCVNFNLEEKIKDLIDPGNPGNPEREKEKRQVYWQKLLHTLCGILTRKWIEIKPGTNISDIIIAANARQYGNDNALIDGGPMDFHQPDTESTNDFLFGTRKEPIGPLNINLENAKVSIEPPNDKTIKVFILDSIPTIDLDNISIENEDLDECVSRMELHPYNGGNSTLFENLTPELNSENEEIEIAGDLSNHGLFSAGIVYRLANHVEIELIEVLNQKCVGDLFSLMWGLYKIQEILITENYNDIYVVNCSFMFRHSLREFQDNTTNGGSSTPFINSTSHYFRRIFDKMDDLIDNPDPMGIICCAAGNDYHSSTSLQTNGLTGSESKVADYYPMAPASFDNTIGIGAFYIKDGSIEPASYSRVPGEGGYWTMGGDFDPEASNPDLISQTLLSFYVSDYLPMNDTDSEPLLNQDGWVRGTGTSFATAIASGICAIYSSLYPDTQTVKAELDKHSDWWDNSVIANDVRATGDDKILPVVQGTIHDNSSIQIPAGSYYVGNNPPGSDNVTLTRDYYIAETEVTYELWEKVYTWATGNGYTFANAGTMGAGSGVTDQHPVTNVNWRDCIVWTNALSERKGLIPCYTYSNEVIKDSNNVNACDNADFHYNADGYRLPTEAEWEIAARGGNIAKLNGTYDTPYSGSYNINDVAWYDSNSGGSTHVVGTREPNELGLYDMSGNINEWCWDLQGSLYPAAETDPVGGSITNLRMCSGGDWQDNASFCNISRRICSTPVYRCDYNGFRLVRTLPSVTYEMQAEEDAQYSSGVVDSNFDGYTGTGFVNTDNTVGAWIQWSVDVDNDCSATCEFRYSSGAGARPMELTINNNDEGELGFSISSAWNDWQTETVDVTLSAGVNTIRLTAITSGGAPHMDKMDITL